MTAARRTPRPDMAAQPPAPKARVAALEPAAPPGNIMPMKMVLRRARASGRSA
jgi:hypothetical protein